MEARSVLGLPAVRPPFLDAVSAAKPRQSQACDTGTGRIGLCDSGGHSLDFRQITCLDCPEFPARPNLEIQRPAICFDAARFFGRPMPAERPLRCPQGVGTEGFGYANRDNRTIA